MECADYIDSIRADFGSLWKCQSRGETLEISTPFSTTTSRFVSVFLVKRNDVLIVGDGGWLHDGVYFDNSSEESTYTKPLEDIIDFFSQKHRVKSKKDRRNRLIYYKIIKDKRLVTAAIYDVACFIGNAVNASNFTMSESIDVEQQARFRGKANKYISSLFQKTKFKFSFSDSLDDKKEVPFSAIIKHGSDLNLIYYVTGSNHSYFMSSIGKATTSFRVSRHSKYNPYVRQRIPLLDNQAKGYQPSRLADFTDELREASNGNLVAWSDKENLKALIS